MLGLGPRRLAHTGGAVARRTHHVGRRNPRVAGNGDRQAVGIAMQRITARVHRSGWVVELEVVVEAVEEGDEELVGVLLLVARHVVELVPHCVQQVRGDKRVSTISSIKK